MNPYDIPTMHKEECLAQISKRLKKTLCKIKNNTLKQSFIQTILFEPKADDIVINYSTIILQHRGKSSAEIAKELNTFLTHVSGTIQNVLHIPGASGNKHPAQLSQLSKVREVFQTYATGRVL